MHKLRYININCKANANTKLHLPYLCYPIDDLTTIHSLRNQSLNVTGLLGSLPPLICLNLHTLFPPLSSSSAFPRPLRFRAAHFIHKHNRHTPLHALRENKKKGVDEQMDRCYVCVHKSTRKIASLLFSLPLFTINPLHLGFTCPNFHTPSQGMIWLGPKISNNEGKCSTPYPHHSLSCYRSIPFYQRTYFLIYNQLTFLPINPFKH